MKTELRLLQRDARSGELTLLCAAITVAVLIVTSISLFAERLQKALVSEAKVFLAADVVLQSPQPVAEKLLLGAVTRDLQRAEIVQFPSMVFAGDEMFLSSVKAASSAYPLLGQLEATDDVNVAGVPVVGSPAPGEAWLDQRLLHLLNIQLGDEVWVGEQAFTAAKILTREPDSGSSYFSLGPRILINLEDLGGTGVVQPGSRVFYRYLFSGEEAAIDSYIEWLKPQLKKRHRLMGLDDSQPGLAQSLERAEGFLLLAGSLGVLLASVAVAMAARRYSLRHYDNVAVMKTLGSTPQQLGRMVVIHLTVVLTVSVLAGALLGWFAQYAFLNIMQEWLPVALPQASIKPFLVGAGTGVVCTLAFALPMMWQLRTVSPLRVLRRELGSDADGNTDKTRYFYLLGALAIFALMWFYSQHLLITSLVFFGTLFCGLVVGGIAWFVLGSIRVLGTQAGSVWRLAVANLQRGQLQSVLQLVVFGLALMLLLISVLIRTSIVREWELQLPPDTPNHFLINIAPYQVEPLKELLAEHELKTAGMYPMVRGRLTHLNDIEATTIIGEEVDEVYRELNLTWSETFPEDNVLVAGQWWDDNSNNSSDRPLVSVEQELADNLGVTVGDKLTFTIGDKKLDVTLGSIRELRWDTMRPNFYFIFEPGVLENYSATHITSFYLPQEKKLLINDILRQFPTISIFELDEMLYQIKTMVDQVTQAIELVLGLILISGALVLIASVQASIDQRMQENAILRTLGAPRRLILGSLCLEFILLGLGAGLMAALGSELTAWGLQTQAFRMEYTFHPWLWLAGPVLGAVLICGLGLAASYRVVRVPPLVVLRELM